MPQLRMTEISDANNKKKKVDVAMKKKTLSHEIRHSSHVFFLKMNIICTYFQFVQGRTKKKIGYLQNFKKSQILCALFRSPQNVL